MPLRECMERTTYREYLTWMAWLLGDKFRMTKASPRRPRQMTKVMQAAAKAGWLSAVGYKDGNRT